MCKEGDVRRHSRMSDPGLSWRLRVFHGICVGLRQLHSKDIVHQDLKPSNVLVFEERKSKIADLGRSSLKGTKTDYQDHCGDVGYTPIELLYGHFHSDWDTRRKAADLYMLGGLLAFLTINVHIFALILGKLPDSHHPRNWTGTYTDALAVITTATYDAIEEIVHALPSFAQADVRNLLMWLCNPEPHLRGHPTTVGRRMGDKFSLERIVSVANMVATKAEISK